MRTVKSIPFALLVLSLLLLGSGSAFAQATRTWVSGVGDDANPCSRTAPCKTFAGAISKTAAGGEINCLDPGGFGAVNITKSMTIVCEDTVGGVLHSGTNGIIVNAGATDRVVLRGLDINGGTPVSPGVNGIRFLAGGSLVVDDCVIYNSAAADPSGNGIVIANAAGVAEVQVLNSLISGNGSAAGSGAGILIQPTGSGSVDLTVNNTVLANNRVGLRANSTTTSGTIDVTVIDSTAASSAFHGFVAHAPTGQIRMMLNRVRSIHNAEEGIRANGAGAVVTVGDSVVTGNATGVAPLTGGAILSYGNNQINGNTVNGTVTPVALQ